MKRKRFVLTLFVALLVVSVLTALCACTNKISFRQDSDGYIITGCGKSIESLTIPSEYNGLPVTEIDDNAFFDRSNLQSVTFANDSKLQRIGSYAFANCSSLKEITIPSSVTDIGDNAFAECDSLSSLRVEQGNPKYHSEGNCIIETATRTLIAGCCNSTIPNGGSVTGIGENAFYSCNNLMNITVPSAVTSIGSSAFFDCNNLQTVMFGENSLLQSIGECAFQGCSELKGITIPSSVADIERFAFYHCDSLQRVTFEDDSLLQSINEYTFSCCDSLTEITIPRGIASIYTHAFADCGRLQTVTFEIDSQLQSIGEAAFMNCGGLAEITIPANVARIGSHAFDGCTNLNSVTFETSDYWYAGTEQVDLLIPSRNAEYLKYTYRNYDWWR